MEEAEPKKSGFRSPFKFNFTTASLTQNRTKDSSGTYVLKPRKGLDLLNKPVTSPASDGNRQRWSTLSPLASQQYSGLQTGSESRINTLGRFESGAKLTAFESPVRENGVNIVTKSGSFTEDKSDSSPAKRYQRSIYDRPKSQVYTSSPLTEHLSNENHYDTPKSQNDLSRGKIDDKSVTMASKTLFPKGGVHNGLEHPPDYVTNDVRTHGSQNKRDAMFVPSNDSVTNSGHNGHVQAVSKSPLAPPTDLSLILQSPPPVAPPRKQSSSNLSLLKSPCSPSPISNQADVVSPTAKPRKKWHMKQISLDPKILDDDEFIGFASLPEQVHRKAVKRGFEFCLMVVGETGLGKSTLINSLFLTDLYKDRKIPNAQDCVDTTIEIVKKQLEIEERGVKVRLSVVDTPGFNDAVNGDENWRPVIEYVDKQFEQYFNAESGVNRKNIQDTRVHCCLYFISPYGHGLKPIDVLVMKKLHNKVNIVPLIAKSDILTPKEVKRLKQKVLEEIEKHQINIYQFPDCDSDEDEEFKSQNSSLKTAIPFAVVGSNTVVEVAGKKIRGRMYPWGIVEVDNPKHCDFVKLRQMLISTHMQDLKDITADAHYENYRAEHLLAAGMHRSQKERTKLKRESIIGNDALIDTDSLLAQKEAEIQRMQEMMIQLQAQLQNSPRGQVNGQTKKT